MPTTPQRHYTAPKATTWSRTQNLSFEVEGPVALNREGLGNTFCKELVLMSAVPCLLLIHHVEMKSPSGVLEMLTTVPSHKKYSCGSVIM